MKTSLICSFIIFLSIFSSAQIKQNDDLQLSGNIKLDSKTILGSKDYSELPELLPQQDGKKSPFLAGLMSLVIPGAGEVYSESYIKAAVFVVLEAAVITTAVIYDNKGDDQTETFEKYADDYTNPDHNWSVIRYAKWLIDFEQGDPNMILSENSNTPPWEQVNWTLLNNSEHGSHKLPRHGEQQYYELIGKYHQYSSGWNDFTGGANKEAVSPNMLFYSGMRGKANDYYNIASKAVIFIYVNHFLSALDGVWSAIEHNSDLAFKLRLEERNYAFIPEYTPTLNISFNF